MRYGVAAGVVGLAVVLWFGGAATQEQKKNEAAGAGERVFVVQGCYGCHLVGKFGTPIGPDLSHIGARYSEAYLARWLQDPEVQRPTAHMPKLELTAEEVRTLAAYLSGLH
jgi:cbb3-type cytochrome oxidase cytochrome c subunit